MRNMEGLDDVYGQPLTTIHDPNSKVVASVARSLDRSQLARSALHSVQINDWSGNMRGP